MNFSAYLLQKYGTIIQEEVNVKEVSLLWEEIQVEKLYLPSGQALGPRFGKDTSRIISAAKAWGISLQTNGNLLVTEWIDTRELFPSEYEVRYMGLQEDHQTVEEGVIVSLDMTITDDLRNEWVAREISRFLNQMRKDAGYKIDARVYGYFETESIYLRSIIACFNGLLQQEALLHSLENWLRDDCDFNADFEYAEEKVTFQVASS